MSESVKCATCKTEKPFSEMHTCMQANREYSVCDMNCMVKFYKGEIKPDFVITPDLEEMGKLGMNPKEYHLHKENLELNKQLAKANERVEELEGQLQLTMLTTHEASFESDYGKKRLSKFAIEKKVEGVNWFSEKYCDDEHSFLADKAIEQLRKEQE